MRFCPSSFAFLFSPPGERLPAVAGRAVTLASCRLNFRISVLASYFALAGACPSSPAQSFRAPTTHEAVSFATQDGGIVYANLYGTAQRGVVLAHGGQFNKESWEKQAQQLVKAGFRVLAFDFRGYGQSRGPHGSSSDEGRRFDVLAAVDYLRKTGAKSVAVVGGSMGGDYAAEAAEANPASIDRIVLLASGAYTPLVRMKGPKLYILARDDFESDPKAPRLPQIRAQFEKSSGPKQLVLLDGSAHAQWIFSTPEGDRLMREILRFLSAP
jgi:alpha-beta hydrolase superfamily lysophospholipase